MSRDPIGYDGGVNLYEYVNGRPTVLIDRSGREPGEIFDSKDAALADIVRWVNKLSKERDREHAGWIFEEAGRYWYDDVIEGEQHKSVFRDPSKNPEKACARFHTHGAENPDFDDERASRDDHAICKRMNSVWMAIHGRRLNCFLITPSNKVIYLQ